MPRPSESWLGEGSSHWAWATAMMKCQSSGAYCGSDGYCHLDGECFPGTRMLAIKQDIQGLQMQLEALESELLDLVINDLGERGKE